MGNVIDYPQETQTIYTSTPEIVPVDEVAGESPHPAGTFVIRRHITANGETRVEYLHYDGSWCDSFVGNGGWTGCFRWRDSTFKKMCRLMGRFLVDAVMLRWIR